MWSVGEFNFTALGHCTWDIAACDGDSSLGFDMYSALEVLAANNSCDVVQLRTTVRTTVRTTQDPCTARREMLVNCIQPTQDLLPAHCYIMSTTVPTWHCLIRTQSYGLTNRKQGMLHGWLLHGTMSVDSRRHDPTTPDLCTPSTWLAKTGIMDVHNQATYSAAPAVTNCGSCTYIHTTCMLAAESVESRRAGPASTAALRRAAAT
jgi:hypothetical protein